MANNCPKCGKSIRPGGKFCGACGFKIVTATPAPPPTPPPATPPPGAVPTPTPAHQHPPTPAPEGYACPHCGKPVRQGVKFCASCGKTISTITPPPLSPPEIKTKPRIKTIGFLVGVILLICVSLVVIAWGVGLTDLVVDVFPTSTPDPSTVLPQIHELI